MVTLAPSQTGDKPQLNLPSAQKGPVELRPFIESFIAVGGANRGAWLNYSFTPTR